MMHQPFLAGEEASYAKFQLLGLIRTAHYMVEKNSDTDRIGSCLCTALDLLEIIEKMEKEDKEETT